MQHFLFSGCLGGQFVGVPEPSIENSRIQNVVETICPRLCKGKLTLQEIIWALTPGRCCKKMTQVLAERAAEVTSNISRLLEGAEETPQLLDNIFQLEQTLHEIIIFVRSETQRNVLFRMLFAKDLRLRYFALDRRLIEVLKLFEQTMEKPLVLGAESLSATRQESHLGVASQQAGHLAKLVAANDSSNVHASVSIFPHASNVVVHGGNFYGAFTGQDCNRTPKGIVEGTDVFAVEDVPPQQEIYKSRGYRIYSATSTTKAKAVMIKLYEGSRAKERCSAAARFCQKVMHPNVLHLIGVSPLNAELAFLVFNDDAEWGIESMIAFALSKDLKQSLYLGLQTVVGLSSGLDYLRILKYPFASVGLDHFVVNRSRNGNILISFDPEVLPDGPHEQDRRPDGGNELDVFHGLCQKTFDAACKAHYESQKIQRTYVDELDVNHDLDQDQFEEEFDTKSGLQSVDVFPAASFTASSMSSSRMPPQKTTPRAHRRELVWKFQKHETASLEDIARQFQDFLFTFSTELAFNRRRGRYTTKTAHRCPGYNRIEITLTTDIARSAIVSHLTPTPHEICPVCEEIVKGAEVFACICGGDDNESIPTIRCSTCSEWHHRPCVNIFENDDQSFVCQRCKVQTLLKANESGDDLLSSSDQRKGVNISQSVAHLNTSAPPDPPAASGGFVGENLLQNGRIFYNIQAPRGTPVASTATSNPFGPLPIVNEYSQSRPDVTITYSTTISNSLPGYTPSNRTIRQSRLPETLDSTIPVQSNRLQQGNIVDQSPALREEVEGPSADSRLPTLPQSGAFSTKPSRQSCKLHQRLNDDGLPSRTNAHPFYVCDGEICGEELPDVQSFVDHLKSVHKITRDYSRSGKCWCPWPRCTSPELRVASLQRHILAHCVHWKCPIHGCSHRKPFPRPDALADHLANAHSMRDRSAVMSPTTRYIYAVFKD